MSDTDADQRLKEVLLEIEEFVGSITHVDGDWRDVVIAYVRALRENDWVAWEALHRREGATHE